MHAPTETQESASLFSFDGGWQAFPEFTLKRRKIWPNQLWRSADGKVGALVAIKNERWGNIALSNVGLQYLETALREHRIEAGIVVLAEVYEDVSSVLEQRPLAEVLTVLTNILPRPGPLGPYFLMNADFTPIYDRELF